LLTEALSLSKEANEHSSGWAHRLISNAITSNETGGDDTQFEIADTACNVEAALQGVLNLPDDPVVPVVRAKLEHAISILEAIATFDAQEIHAAIETAPSAPEVAIADIRSWMVLADKKLEQAFDAAESGEHIEVMLDHICHSMVLEPLRLIQREDFTQFDAQRVHTALFPVLAVIHGAIKLAEGTVLHHTLSEACRLLDDAQEELDSAQSLIRALPLDDDALQGADSRASPIQPTAHYDCQEINEVDCTISAAIGVMKARGEEANTNLVYGAILAAEFARDKLARGMAAKSMDECAEASAPLDVATDVLLTGMAQFDDLALRGAWRLLTGAKARLDNEIERSIDFSKVGVK